MNDYVNSNLNKKINSRLKKARKIREENDQGYIEYKWKLCDFSVDQDRLDRLTTQLKFRLYEGSGKAIYNLGYSDNGQPDGIMYDVMLKSLQNLYMICNDIGAVLKNFRVFQGLSGYCANVFIETNDTFEQGDIL
jgi:GTPase